MRRRRARSTTSSAISTFARTQTSAGLPTLLLFHGNGEVVADYDDQAALFAAAGANLAVMDYPGYGNERGTPTLRAIITDALAVYERSAAQFVMGRSLGSACAAELYARVAPRGFILESGFVDLAALDPASRPRAATAVR